MLTPPQRKKLELATKLLKIKMGDVIRQLIDNSLPSCDIPEAFVNDIRPIMNSGAAKGVLPYMAAILDMKLISERRIEYKGKQYDISLEETMGPAVKLRIVSQLFNIVEAEKQREKLEALDKTEEVVLNDE